MNDNLLVLFGNCLIPFNKWFRPSSVEFSCKLVGFEQWEFDVEFFDFDGNLLEIPENNEIMKISNLFNENICSDLIHNIFGNPVFQEMISNNINFYRYKF